MSQNLRLFHIGIEFIPYKLSIFFAHVTGFSAAVNLTRGGGGDCNMTPYRKHLAVLEQTPTLSRQNAER